MTPFPFLTHGLKTRITMSVLAIFLTSLWSLSFYASRMLREDMQGVLGEQQFSAVSYMAAELNAELDDRFKGLENVAARISPATLANQGELQKFLEDRPVLQRMFSGGILALRRDGTALADVPLSTGRIGVNYLDSAHVAATLETGKSTIGRPVIGKKLGVPIISMVVPIRDSQGKVIGALVGVTDMGKPNFLDRISEGHYGKSGGYLLVDSQHRLVITATEKSRVMEKLSDPGVDPLVDRRLQGYEGTEIFVNPRGVEVLNSARGIPLAGWQVIAILPTAEAFEPIRQMQKRMLLATALLTLLAGGLTWWLLRRQLAPMLFAAKTLASLADETKALEPLPIASQDEIGQLIAGFNRLLTTLSLREAALRESESRLRIIIENEPECIKIVDAHGRLKQMNPAGLRMIEADSLDLVAGQPVLNVVAPEYRAAFAEMHERVLAGESMLMEFEVLGLKGGRRWLETHAVPLHDHGETLHLAVTRDITARKQVEAELLRSNTELEQFSFSVSHDMRQPLRMIASYLRLLEKGLGDKLDGEQSDYLNLAIDGAVRMDAMMLGLLEYSRIGRKGERRALIESRAVLDEALLFLRPAIADAQADVDIQGNWPHVFASPDEMVRLLQNLIDNALKFRVAGRQPAITVTSAATDKEWCVTVADNGAGMIPAQIGRLFQVFQRLHGRTAYAGNGIGLALCRKIVEHHGGCIRAESKGEGLGSTFIFTMPVAGGELPTPDSGAAS